MFKTLLIASAVAVSAPMAVAASAVAPPPAVLVAPAGQGGFETGFNAVEGLSGQAEPLAKLSQTSRAPGGGPIWFDGSGLGRDVGAPSAAFSPNHPTSFAGYGASSDDLPLNQVFGAAGKTAATPARPVRGAWAFLKPFRYGHLPEPASWALLLLGFGMIGATLRGFIVTNRRLARLQPEPDEAVQD